MGSRTGYSDRREILIETRPARRGIVREYAETIVLCVLVILFLRTFVFQQSEIPSGSMEQTILIGDHVLVNRFLYAPTLFEWERRLLPVREIRRGDIVVFKHPPQPEQDFIKRVIGLPGETVALRDGELWIDGRPVAEPYLVEAERHGASYGPVRVEPGHYFLLGDHRSRSADSREWGQAAAELIKGRAILILFSTTSEPSPDRPPGQVTAGSLVRKLYDVVFHSRWNRCLKWLR
jgi:signal peptidase I